MLAVDKGPGATSFDVVALVRRRLGVRRVGHAGTLDPEATGVLPILIGEATKLTPYLMDQDKEYVATVRFGGSRRPAGRSSAGSGRSRRCTRRSTTRAGASTSSRGRASRWIARLGRSSSIRSPSRTWRPRGPRSASCAAKAHTCASSRPTSAQRSAWAAPSSVWSEAAWAPSRCATPSRGPS
ncbi:MAG: hypothetical protein HYU25_13255 [Candidatus Rokubacteria bacterium]|nr:hypothetical protein [Candidatus Rokubacteria bacterium]